MRTDLRKVVREYCELQSMLLDEMHSRFPSIAKEPAPQDWPQTGRVSVRGRDWKFLRHGLGFTFLESGEGTIINAHEYIKKRPYPFDAYRLQEFLESRGIQEVYLGETRYPVDDMMAIQEGLERMRRDGVIQTYEPPPNGGVIIYVKSR